MMRSAGPGSPLEKGIAASLYLFLTEQMQQFRMAYCVYILCNKPHGTLYVGSTADLPLRLWQHRSGAKRNSFTARYNLKCLVYVEAHDDMEPARVREYRIKRWRREWKFALIEAQNPDWSDLSDRLL